MNLQHLLPENLRKWVDTPKDDFQRNCENGGHIIGYTQYYIPDRRLAISTCSKCNMDYCRRLTEQELREYSMHVG